MSQPQLRPYTSDLAKLVDLCWLGIELFVVFILLVVWKMPETVVGALWLVYRLPSWLATAVRMRLPR